MNAATSRGYFSSLVQRFFTVRLMNHQNVSSQTVLAYRDTFRLLFRFIEKHTGAGPAALSLSSIDAELILAFLNYLETERGNTVRTRNARLAALRSFYHYVVSEAPEQAAVANRILAIPMKRSQRPGLGYLTKAEMEAIIRAPNTAMWNGRRDQAMFMTSYNTGARVSEVIHIRASDLNLTGTSSVSLHGKGRKERVVPLWKTTARLLAVWRREIPEDPATPLFPNGAGTALSRSGVEFRLRLAMTAASQRMPSLIGRRISPHTIRHTTAMHLLQSRIDIAVIALWFGHESIETTHQYMEADLQTKERAMASLAAPNTKAPRFRAEGNLLAFLNNL